MTQDAQQGRVFLILAIAITLLGDLCIIALKIFTVGFVPAMVGSILRWFITAALFYAIWRGHKWTRWLMVGLISLCLLVSVPAMMRTLHPMVIGIVLQFSITLILLVIPRIVSAFLEHQRARHFGKP